MWIIDENEMFEYHCNQRERKMFEKSQLKIRHR